MTTVRAVTAFRRSCALGFSSEFTNKLRLERCVSVLTELVVAFAVMALCVVIHIIGMASLTVVLLRRRSSIEQRLRFVTSSVLLIIVFSVVILLHVLETTIWAGFYWWQRLFENFETALYFSFKTYTTIGYGDVLLPERWRLLSGVEGLSGVLLCGLSTAFLFAIVNALFQMRIRPRADS